MADVLSLIPAEPTREAMAVMRLSLVDWLACGIAGAHEPGPVAVRGLVAEEGGQGQATLFGGGRAPARAAALFNGTASHALDYDDTHFAHIGHVSVGILPAAMAMAERDGRTLGEMTRAALMGCEAAIRMGLRLGRGHYQVGFHQTATAGAYGAAHAASLLHGADAGVHAHALGLASTRASGLKSQFGTDGKPFNAGIAASNGVEAALLAARGMVSDPAGWTGPQGFVATHHGDGSASQPTGFLMPAVQHKFHACCHGLHATLEALASLKPLAAAEVERVTVYTHPRWLTVCDKPAPRTGLELKFSYRAVVALSVLGYDTAALATFSDALAHDPAVCALRDRVTVRPDDSLTETAARLTLVSPGETRTATHDLSDPLPLDARAARVRAKAAALLGAARADAVWQAVHADPGAPIAGLAALMA